MRIFVTGASGFIGTRLVPELIENGHEVTGLSRSQANSDYLRGAGADVHEGSLEQPETLQAGAQAADAVIHLGFNNDFAHLADMCDIDARAVQALGAGLAGTDRPLLISSFSGLGNTKPGEPALESNEADPDDVNPRTRTEIATQKVLADGVNVSLMRLPMVHDPLKQGIITAFVQYARQKGVSAYVGDGTNRFPSSAVDDVARIYRLAIENPVPGMRWHAVAEEGVAFHDIAEMIGRGLNVPVKSVAPEEAGEQFTYLADFAGRDLSASSAETRRRLDWHPSGPTLLEDMALLRFGKDEEA